MLEAANKALEHSEHSFTLLVESDFLIDDPVTHSRDVIRRLSQFLPLMEQQHEMNSRLDSLLQYVNSLQHLTGKLLLSFPSGISFLWSYYSPPIMGTTEYMVFTLERLTMKQASGLETLLSTLFSSNTAFLAAIEA